MINRHFFTLLFLLFIAALSSLAQGKRALIIAVGDYSYDATKWTPISSGNDVDLVKNALLQQGFKDEDICVVKDGEATKAGMVSSFENLISKTKPGDVVFIHFSGHGQQIQDDNGDEVDGYDEALIPIDAQLIFKKGVYEGENHFRDDEFGAYLERIRKSAGNKGNVLVVIDACHSGTGSRGEGISRGTAVPFQQPDFKPQPLPEQSSSFGLYLESDDHAPMACFYGAASHQLNFEYKMNDSKSVGSLSYAFSKAFAEAKPTNTYKGLFDRIKLEMAKIAPRQNPQSEGTLDQQILGGKIVGTPNYSTVTTFYDSKNVTINKGRLHGINEGSRVGFFDIDERDYASKTPKATGTVSFADVVTAEIELDVPIDEKVAKESWVFVTEQNFGSMAVSAKIDIKDPTLARALSSTLENVPLIKISNDSYDLIVEDNNQFTRGNNVLISTTSDTELWSKPLGAGNEDRMAREIVDRIIGYSQTRYLRNLEVEDFNLYSRMEIIPIKVRREKGTWVEEGELPVAEFMDPSGNLVFKEGDYFKVRVTNEGSQMVYLSIIDIQPDDVINVLIPERGKTAEEYRLAPGDKWNSRPIKLVPPFGLEVFKLIACDTPMDLGPVLQSRGENPQSKGAGSNPFQKLFSDSFKPEVSSRGVETTNLPAGSTHVTSIIFQIRAKE